MIFDSKRRQANEAEADTATLVETKPGAASLASEDVRTVPPAGARPAERDDRLQEEPAAAGRAERDEANRDDRESLEPLFPADVAREFRRGWDEVQIGFVDDPRQAVQKADELVHQVLHNLTEAFSGERSRMAVQGTQAGADSTEQLRVALRRYRAFLHRLLAL